MGSPGFKRKLYEIFTQWVLHLCNTHFLKKTKRTEEMIHPLRCVLFETILFSF